MAKIVLDKKESVKYFHAALCNGIGYVQSGYGLVLSTNGLDYSSAKADLINEHGVDHCICREDVWVQILKNNKSISFLDTEDNDTEYKITIKDVYKRMSEVPFDHMSDMINDQDDAITADVILQTVFLGEVIYG